MKQIRHVAALSKFALLSETSHATEANWIKITRRRATRFVQQQHWLNKKDDQQGLDLVDRFRSILDYTWEPAMKPQ